MQPGCFTRREMGSWSFTKRSALSGLKWRWSAQVQGRRMPKLAVNTHVHRRRFAPWSPVTFGRLGRSTLTEITWP